jgi:anaerobic selenocysteine-containing dehydrogenase
MTDVLLEVSRGLSTPLNPALPQTYQEMLQSAFEGLPVDGGWAKIQEQGGWWGEVPQSAAAAATASAASPQAASATVDPQFDGAPGEYPYHFLPYASQAFFDGSLAHLPWLQELPDVLTTAMWRSWVEINPKTAEQLGVVQGELVEITSGHGSLRTPVLVSPGIAPDVIAMPVGQGHETFTRYASGRGANPVRILAPLTEPETGALAWAATRVRVSKVEGNGGLILFAGGMREHDEHSHR